MSQSLIEKIVQNHAVDIESDVQLHSGDYIFVKPDYIMTHDNSSAVMNKFNSLNIDTVADARQIVLTLDHNIQDSSEKNLAKYRSIEQFARKHGIDFYPAGRGIGHQIMCEEGYAWPGTLVVASDSHSNMYGGLGCLGTPVVRTDAATIWATGETWWQIPPVAQCELLGELQPGVSGKDIIVTLCGLYNSDEVLNHAVEFVGESVPSLSIDQRLTIANMTTEWGALAGVFPIDHVTCAWLRKRMIFVQQRASSNKQKSRITETHIAKLENGSLQADQGAFYAKKLMLDLSHVRPHVSGPDHVKTMVSVSEIEQKNIKVDKAYLVSCVNSRVEDIAEAAEIVRGKTIANGVEFYIGAASSEVEEESKNRGDWQVLVDAGAIPLPPGCGPCIGLGKGLLQDGEVGISATNRNFKGRMGSRNAQAYLGSPAVVAASAVAGKISAPQHFENVCPVRNITVNVRKQTPTNSVTLIEGMPETIEGELLYCFQDNLNTDRIYPGKYTYNEEIFGKKMADVVMENYDPGFRNLVKEGDILVGGTNFGTGSSREQAATAFQHSGIRMVVAASLSETYKRNALNNGLLILESPDLVSELKLRFGDTSLTVRTRETARVIFGKAVVEAFNKEFSCTQIGTTAQKLYVVGGIVQWIKQKSLM